jgi:curved DNA-binding protein CbpA
LADKDKEKLKSEIDLIFFEEKMREKDKKSELPPFDPKVHWKGSGEQTVPVDSPYKILGVEETASQEDIKKAYRRSAHKFHPDIVSSSPEQKSRAEEWFKLINTAYSQISYPEGRKLYDLRGYGTTLEGLKAGTSPADVASRAVMGKPFGTVSMFDPELMPYDYMVSTYFPGIQPEELRTDEARNKFISAYEDFLFEKSKRERSPYCLCDSPYNPKFVEGNKTCSWCEKQIKPGFKKEDLKGLGPGLGKVR